ncbi:MAG: hypothetical protein O2897_03570 [bacterium]|nr:hypothetical protein [bacterium]
MTKKVLFSAIILSVLYGIMTGYGIYRKAAIENLIISKREFFEPSTFLLDKKNVVDADKRWVVLMSHGLMATYYEWEELSQFLFENYPQIYQSRVMLGKHGQGLESFNNSNWRDWQKPLLTEYQRLVDMGFKKIMLVTSSSSGPLLMEAMTNPNSVVFRHPPTEVVMVDPIFKFAKAYQNIPYWLSFVNLTGALDSIIGFQDYEKNHHPMELKYWYMKFSLNVIASLGELLNVVERNMDAKIFKAYETNFQIFSATKDKVVNTKSGKLISQKIKTINPMQVVNLYPVNSELHFFIRLNWRLQKITKKDLDNQTKFYAFFGNFFK